MKGKKGYKKTSMSTGKGSVAYRAGQKQIGGEFNSKDPWAVSRVSETEQKRLIASAQVSGDEIIATLNRASARSVPEDGSKPIASESHAIKKSEAGERMEKPT